MMRFYSLFALVAGMLLSANAIAGDCHQTIIRERIVQGQTDGHCSGQAQLYSVPRERIQIERFQLRDYQRPQPIQLETRYNYETRNFERFEQANQRQRFRTVQRIAQPIEAGNGGNFDIRPTGLAAVLGTGGPRIRVRNGQLQSVQPTGIAGFLGLGGPAIDNR